MGNGVRLTGTERVERRIENLNRRHPAADLEPPPLVLSNERRWP